MLDTYLLNPIFVDEAEPHQTEERDGHPSFPGIRPDRCRSVHGLRPSGIEGSFIQERFDVRHFGRDRYVDLTRLASNENSRHSENQSGNLPFRGFGSSAHGPGSPSGSSTPASPRDILRSDDESTSFILRLFAFLTYDSVPVWDARGWDFDLTAHCHNLHQLPRFQGEIPHGSFVVVAHAISVQPAEPVYYVNFNILWAILIATKT